MQKIKIAHLFFIIITMTSSNITHAKYNYDDINQNFNCTKNMEGQRGVVVIGNKGEITLEKSFSKKTPSQYLNKDYIENNGYLNFSCYTVINESQPSNIVENKIEVKNIENKDITLINIKNNFDYSVLYGKFLSDYSTIHTEKSKFKTFYKIISVLSKSTFNGTIFSEGLEFNGVDLREVDFSKTKNIEKVIFNDIYYDKSTKWPKDFTPPPSRKNYWVYTGYKKIPLGNDKLINLDDIKSY